MLCALYMLHVMPTSMTIHLLLLQISATKLGVKERQWVLQALIHACSTPRFICIYRMLYSRYLKIQRFGTQNIEIQISRYLYSYLGIQSSRVLTSCLLYAIRRSTGFGNYMFSWPFGQKCDRSHFFRFLLKFHNLRNLSAFTIFDIRFLF